MSNTKQLSLISAIVMDNPDDYEEILMKKRIRTVLDDEFPQLRLFTAEYDADYGDPVVREANGIIINIDSGLPVCFPVEHILQNTDNEAPLIETEHVTITEDIEGDSINMWYNTINGKFMYSSRNMIDTRKEELYDGTYKTLYEAIYNTEEHEMFHTYVAGNANRYKKLIGYTFSFILISERKLGYIDYSIAAHGLYCIGVKRSLTGKEFDFFQWLGTTFGSNNNATINKKIWRPLTKQTKLVNFHGLKLENEYFNTPKTLEDTELMAEDLNVDRDLKIRKLMSRGFIVADNNFERLRIQSPLYSMIQNIYSKENTLFLISLIVNDRIDIESFFKNSADKMTYLYALYYQFEIQKLKYQIIDNCSYMVDTYNLWVEKGVEFKYRKDLYEALKSMYDPEEYVDLYPIIEVSVNFIKQMLKKNAEPISYEFYTTTIDSKWYYKQIKAFYI